MNQIKNFCKHVKKRTDIIPSIVYVPPLCFHSVILSESVDFVFICVHNEKGPAHILKVARTKAICFETELATKDFQKEQYCRRGFQQCFLRIAIILITSFSLYLKPQ